MKNLFLIVAFSLSFSINLFSADVHVRLRGHNIQGWKGETSMSNKGIGQDCRRSKEYYLKLDKSGNFDTTITVNKPEYWYMADCDTYIVPGGQLDITYDKAANDFRFAGTTAKECEFMAKYPLHLWVDLSFLNGGKNAKKTFEETKEIVDSLAAKRISLLESTTGLDPNFVAVERALTKAHQVNSYINYYMFTKGYVKCSMGDEYKIPSGKKFLEGIRKYVTPFAAELLKEGNVVNYDIRFVVERCVKDGLITIPAGSHWNQLSLVKDMLEKVEDSASDKTIGAARKLLAKLTNTDLSEILKNEIDRVDVLASGKPAFDIELEDVDGKAIKLSDYKGKTIYVDMWATWCGYCIKEFPSFLKLKEKFPNVVFVSISTDESKALWKKYLAAKPKTDVVQCLSVNRVKLGTNWNIHGIPRFLLIDKNYKIVDAFAPRPSDPKAAQLLEQNL